MALELAHEGELLAGGLEATVAELRRGVDELELDLLHRRPAGLREARLAEGEDALLDADSAALDQDVVLLALTVVREATHRGDGLLGDATVMSEAVEALKFVALPSTSWMPPAMR